MSDTQGRPRTLRQYHSMISVKVGTWKIQGNLGDIHKIIPHISASRGSANPVKILETDAVPAKVDLSPLIDAAKFIVHLVEVEATQAVLKIVLRLFEQDFLQNNDIHSLALKLDPPLRQPLLLAFYQSFADLEHPAKSALLQAAQDGDAALFGVFGGQGGANITCLRDLRYLYNTYTSFVEDLFHLAASTLQELQNSSGINDYTFDLMRWLVFPDEAPVQADIASAPISFPLIGLVSLAHYCITCKMTSRSPGDLRNLFAGVTGHSQGIIAAAAVAQSTTWDSFYEQVRISMKILFWIGLESHYAVPTVILPAVSDMQSLGDGKGLPSSMLSVTNLSQKLLMSYIKEVNMFRDVHEHVYLALVNSPSSMVVAGPPEILLGLCDMLQQSRAPKDLDQSKIPFPKRRPVFEFAFLPISAPFHTPHLQEASDRVLEALKSERLSRRDLGIPLYHTSTGADMRSKSSEDFLGELVRMIMVDTVDWAAACLPNSFTHLLDFGPGRPSSLLHALVEGSGVRMIAVSENTKASEDMGSKGELFSPYLLSKAMNWSDEYGPSLVTKSDGEVTLSTKMTRLLGTPPVMVAGMTPTTVPWDFVRSVMQAGYHVELAAGGYVGPESLETAILKISNSVPAGRGITCNLIYASPKAISWQISLIKTLIGKGVRIDGLTIGAGVPSVDIATEWIQTLGLKHISFKPGSVDGIMNVLSIAESNPDFPICIQWTGGRAGGHHSYEDFHEPMLKTYGRIRKHSNIILIAGSGFGDAPEIAKYITGGWSSNLGLPAMPFDGVLLGSRMMVAKEAHTSPLVKSLIVQSLGCDDSAWHKSYDGSAGGVMTVSSEMGQPIHKIANRAVMLWKDLDNRIFSIKDPAKRLEKLQASREEIITRLNNDYAKPWFAVNNEGVSVEIEDMTYSECLQRLVKLMYVRSQQRWIDITYRKLVTAFAMRLRERLHASSEFVMDDDWDPATNLDDLLSCYPSASTEYIYAEDVSFFIGLCRARGQKPVNFIPRLDAHFETWFKKDSLWQAEDLDAVVDQDPQRVCIIHGPVAARHSTKADESVSSILDGITKSLVEILQPNLPRQHFIEEPHTSPKVVPTLQNVIVETKPMRTEYHFADQGALPENNVLISHILQDHDGWAQACLSDKHIRRDAQYVLNPIRAAFKPRHGDKIVVTKSLMKLQTITLKTRGANGQLYSAISMACFDGLGVKVTMQTGTQNSAGHSPNLVYGFNLVPQDQNQRLHEDMNGRDERIQAFYADLWGHDSLPSQSSGIERKFIGETTTLSYKMVEAFMTVVAKTDPVHPVRESPSKVVPLDICVVICWVAITKPLVTSRLRGDLQRLLHRSNSFQYCPGVAPLAIGDVLQTYSRVAAISILPAGKQITIVATIMRNNEPVVKVTSVFLIQGIFEGEKDTFQLIEPPEMVLEVDSLKLESLLRSRHWFTLKDPTKSLMGTTLIFKLRPYTMKSSSLRMSAIKSTGEVFQLSHGRTSQSIGDVDFAHEFCSSNPIVDFLQRHGNPANNNQPLESPGWQKESVGQVRIPNSCAAYSRVSKDTNPIHTDPIFANYAHLPGIIAHGMYTSAAVRRLVERAAANADCSRFRQWSCSFEGMVQPGDILDVELQHTSMIQGRMIFKIRAYHSVTRNKVLEADAEIEQAPTSYLFCGQGSQEKGMGLAAYNSSPAAKATWDRGDQHFLETYGFSLLNLVKNDPKTMTIHFGGKRGRQIRKKYLSMTRKAIRNGRVVMEPILDGLTADTLSYTFSEERGLLFSTQFAQPALTLMEIAELEALKSKGVVQPNGLFAGHSLGEYSALGACTTFMSLERLLDLVFYRGITMQSAITRDEFGRTDFSMVAVNPSRVSRRFKQDSFEKVVQQIVSETGLLLEIVNWNIEEQQYVCAGQLQALWILGEVCSALAFLPPSATYTPESTAPFVREQHNASKDVPTPIELKRGIATVPLNGIDIPFHSTYLRGGVDTYREYLKENIQEEDLVLEQFVGKWVPNVVGKPFGIGRDFVEAVAGITGSQVLEGALRI